LSAYRSSSTTGPVLYPKDPGYDAARIGHNRSVEHLPAVIFCVADVNDVVEAVRHGSEGGLPVLIQATGHGPTISADGGVLINTSRMRAIDIDPVARTARFEAGVRSADLIDAAAEFGLAPLNGSSPTVGAVSYHLGGGVGIMSRRLGYAADFVRAIELVTADGLVRRTTPEQEADLFWALRGGGKGRFGVVTAMEIDLHPVTRLYGGGMHFGADATPEVLHAYASWTKSVPEAMGSSVLLVRMPHVPEVPTAIRGRYVTHVRFAYTGASDEGERLVDQFRQFSPLTDTVKDMPYREVGTIHAEPTQPSPLYSRTSVLRTLNSDAVEMLLEYAGPQSDAPFMVELRHLGGALSRLPDGIGLPGRREGQFCLYTGGPAVGSEIPAMQMSLLRLHNAMAPWSTGGTCLNFVAGPDATSEDFDAAFLPNDLPRLHEIKKRTDPFGTFPVSP
jgi:hypothetical protein